MLISIDEPLAYTIDGSKFDRKSRQHNLCRQIVLYWWSRWLPYRQRTLWLSCILFDCLTFLVSTVWFTSWFFFPSGQSYDCSNIQSC